MTESSWTTDRVDMLKRLYADGLSAGQISAKLGVTRNTVCGKLHRLQLNPEPKKRGRPAKAQPKQPGPIYGTLAPQPLPASPELVSMRAAKTRPVRPVTLAKAPSNGNAVVSLLRKADTAAVGGLLTSIGTKRKHAPAPITLASAPLPFNADADDPALDGAELYDIPPVEKPRGLTLFELTATSCRYPFGTPGAQDFYFCGETAVTKRPYCAHHLGICCPGTVA